MKVPSKVPGLVMASTECQYRFRKKKNKKSLLHLGNAQNPMTSLWLPWNNSIKNEYRL